MSRIISMPTTKAYRDGWSRIFGKINTSSHWYRLGLCTMCDVILTRKRVYGEKPKKRADRCFYVRRCNSCLDMLFSPSPRFA